MGDFMTVCPECRTGKLYERITEDGYTERSCYTCGYYWNSSEGYDGLTIRLHKEYFPTEHGWKASPAVGQPFTSPDHWTEPIEGTATFN
jgi:Zn ribbon nucleic-acid-binding protein